MPIKISDEQAESEIILDVINFIADKKYFLITNKNGESITVNYVPESVSTWDKKRLSIFLFENPYLNAENDVFQVKVNTVEERLGWIFPITILESNENDFADNTNLNNYKFIAYQKLLEKNVLLKPKSGSSEYTLAEMFPNSLVCILSNDALSKIPDFKITDYLFSFYNFGYIKYKDGQTAKGIYDRSAFLANMRENRSSLRLKKSNFDINSNDYIEALFVTDHLLQSESYLVRFIFLYQIIEHFIAIEFNKQFEVYLNNYQESLIGKNDLRESIASISKERNLIKDIINRIPIHNLLKVEFITECDFLFEDLNLQMKQDTFPDKIYDLRNILVHRFRELTNKNESMNRILEIFERIITNLLISYTDIDSV